ncbi:MAG: hypothetical protein RDV48_11470 [Candidatus Eremiobacteraeota bacterium]|nr:hypothetical protein [Candidatus Eremiobacteraeota bacterium]
MKTRPSAIFMVVICTFLISYAQVCYKIASQTFSLDLGALIRNIPLWEGLSLYGIGAILLVYALKKGELSILYPFLALSYVWVSIFATRLLPVPEHMNHYKWIGVVIIILGVTFIGIGSKAENS